MIDTIVCRRNIFTSESSITRINLFDFVEEAEETALREFFRVEFFWSDDLTAVLGEFEALLVSVDIEFDLSHNIGLLAIEISLESLVNADNAIFAAMFADFEVFSSAPGRMRLELEETPLAVTTEQDLLFLARRVEELNLLGVDVTVSGWRIDSLVVEMYVQVAQLRQFVLSGGWQVVGEVWESSFVGADR